MHFLIDASMPSSAAPVLQSLGHLATDVRDIGMGSAPDAQIAAYAKSHRLCILTRDLDFADIRGYPPEEFHGIVAFRTPGSASREVVLNMLRRLLGQQTILDALQGRLAVVDMNRIRLRPAS